MRLKQLIFLFIFAAIFGAATIGFAEVSETHWAYPAVEGLAGYQAFDFESFELGQPLSGSELETWLKNLNEFEGITFDAADLSESSLSLTRIDVLKRMMDAMGFDALARQLNDTAIPFSDVTESRGYVKLAYEFGLISLSPNGQFRPNDLISKEEAATIVYKVVQKQMAEMQKLMSYYAINSYGQAELSTDLTDLIFGWSQFIWQPDVDHPVLDTTSTEYRIPAAYELALEAVDFSTLKRHLMITVRNEKVYDSEEDRSVNLVEYIIAHPEDAVAQISKQLSSPIAFDGVVIDFEGLKGSENAEALIHFLVLLDAAIEPSNLELMVAVHPVMANSAVYFDGYDFKAIGELADSVILMAHDYYPKTLTDADMASGITLTPLAPIAQVQHAINAILDPNTGISDRSKVILQLSMDTVQWKLIEGNVINRTPYHPSYNAIYERLETGAAYAYSENYESPNIVFLNESDGTRNIVWYEDSESIQAKIDLAKYYDLGGISVWRLGTIPAIEGTSLDLWHQIMENY